MSGVHERPRGSDSALSVRRVPPRWIFLPGLDGTGMLFDNVLKELPEGIDARAVRYPEHSPSTAAELVHRVESSLPSQGEYVIVAESFSGPLVLRVIGGHCAKPVALVLCSSFGRSPISNVACILMGLVAPAALRCRIPRWLIRRYLVGDRERLIGQFRKALTVLSGTALASRFSALGEFTDSFVPPSLAIPILYLRATEDRLVHQRDLAWLQARYNNLEVREIQSPHLLLQCQPKVAVDIIMDFLVRVVGGCDGAERAHGV